MSGQHNLLQLLVKTSLAVLGCSLMINAAQAEKHIYRGWPSLRLRNGLIEVQVVPLLGGRIIQCSLVGHDYLWVNPLLAGKAPPPAGLGDHGEWLNYGGDKLWPAPQGWDGPDQWPGPPDAILDGSPHVAAIVQESGREASVKLVSRKDAYAGIQFSRTVSVPEGSACVLVHATMINVDTKPRRWGIWSVTQLDASSPSGAGYNQDFHAYIPVNRQSRFANGYQVLYGDKDNPQFQLDHNRNFLRTHYQRKVGKVGLDSCQGWVANVDGANGFVFVQAFDFRPGHEYPDGSTVEYWTNGLGKIFAWGRLLEMPSDPSENPYVIETELLGPLETLQPGESASFDYEWRVARIGGSFPILRCTAAGCTAEALACHRSRDGELSLSGRFGVFYSGSARARVLDAAGKPLWESPPIAISPVAPLVMQAQSLNAFVPASARTVEVVVSDSEGKQIGPLGDCTVQHE